MSFYDSDAFLAFMRVAYLIVSVVWIYSVWRWPKRWVALAGFLLLVFLGWLESSFPLERVYGLLVPGDRVRNLSWCMAVAAGNPPLSTGVVGQVSLEPFWASLVAAISLWSPDRVLAVYPFLPLAAMGGLALSLYVHFRREEQDSEAGPAGLTMGDLRGLLVAASVLLMATAPLGFVASYRALWAKMFMLKPNHVLGLVLIPVVVSSISRNLDKGFMALLRSGLVLGLLSLAFVIHWAFVCISLILYIFWRWLIDRKSSGRELVRLGVIMVVSAVFVAPAVYMLLEHYPAALTLARGTYPETPMRSDWGDILPPYESLLFLVTLDQGVVFYLGVIGAMGWYRRGTRKAGLWLSLLVGAYVLWIVNYLLYLTSRARESDEFYYFVVFTLAVAAGNGVFEVVKVVEKCMRHNGLGRTVSSFTIACSLVLPLGLPYWWEPGKMDVYFRVAREPVPEHVVAVTDWIRRETQGTEIFLTTGEIFQWIPAFSGRRTVVAPQAALHDLKETVFGRLSLYDRSSAFRRVLDSGVDYIVYDLAMAAEVGARPAVLESRLEFPLVFQTGHLRVYRIVEGVE